MKSNIFSRGFSLPELIISIAIITIVAGVAISSYSSIRGVNDPQRAVYVYANTLREASRKARLMEYDSAWGVRLGSTSATLFSGATYATRVASRDVSYDFSLSGPITASGQTSDVVFLPLTGLSSTTGTTTFSNAIASSSVYLWTGGIIGY